MASPADGIDQDLDVASDRLLVKSGLNRTLQFL